MIVELGVREIAASCVFVVGVIVYFIGKYVNQGIAKEIESKLKQSMKIVEGTSFLSDGADLYCWKDPSKQIEMSLSLKSRQDLLSLVLSFVSPTTLIKDKLVVSISGVKGIPGCGALVRTSLLAEIKDRVPLLGKCTKNEKQVRSSPFTATADSAELTTVLSKLFSDDSELFLVETVVVDENTIHAVIDVSSGKFQSCLEKIMNLKERKIELCEKSEAFAKSIRMPEEDEEAKRERLEKLKEEKLQNLSEKQRRKKLEQKKK
jgi:hypothetical protein